MNVLEQMERDLSLVMDTNRGDSVPVGLAPEGGSPLPPLMGKFDEAYAAVAGPHADVSSTAPTAFLRARSVKGALGRRLTRRDRLHIDGRVFRPEDIQPDGFGLLVIRLFEE